MFVQNKVGIGHATQDQAMQIQRAIIKEVHYRGDSILHDVLAGAHCF